MVGRKTVDQFGDVVSVSIDGNDVLIPDELEGIGKLRVIVIHLYISNLSAISTKRLFPTGLVVLNLPSYAGGMNLWGTTREGVRPSFDSIEPPSFFLPHFSLIWFSIDILKGVYPCFVQRP